MAKGGAFEREFCHLLSRWWEGADYEDAVFWRTAGSGGRATRRQKFAKRTTAAHCGDVYALDARGAPLTSMFAIELKNGYTGVRLQGLVESKKPARESYHSWIQQAVHSACHAKAPWWWLVHGTNFHDPGTGLLVMPAEAWDMMRGATVGVAPPVVRLTVADSWTPFPGAPPGGGKFTIAACRLGAFLAAATPADIRRLAERAAKF